MTLASEQEVEAFLESHPGWERAGQDIRRTYQFNDFNEAMGFVTRVGLLAEKANHHPDIDIRWNQVTLAVHTHSEGGLTMKDLGLADAADGMTTA